ncbi:restriction endonuclease subunit S [Lysinibacillus sphaericus]|uniref:restriction endonuclease subunit S n=1 Tax=Lysinibacillus sphaericus TaxID=1421 RepID=UPI003D728588
MEFKRLGDLATYINGYAFKPEQWGKTGLPIIRIQNLNNVDAELNYFDGEIDQKYVINHGDVLIAWSASLGVYEWQREKALLNQHIFKVVFNKLTVDKTYFKFMVSYALNLATKYLHGSTMKHITKKYFDEIKIPYPDISIQERLGKALEQVMNLQKKRQSQITALDELTQSLFLEMFGDPKVNNFNWDIGEIKDLTSNTQYGSSKKASEEIGKYPILRMNNITYNGGWDLKQLKYIDLDEKEIERYTVKRGDILFNRTNSKELVGKTAVFRETDVYSYAGYLIRLRVNNKANPEFISAYLNSKYGKSILLNKAKSIVGMANINAKELQSIPVYLPPKELQDTFAEYYHEILKQQERLEIALGEMKTLYSSLLQKAFKGELFQE